MKKLCAILFTICLFFTVGCGDKESGSSNFIVPFAEYDLKEYVELPEHIEKKIEIPSVSVSDEDIDDRIEFLLTSASVDEEQKDGIVEDGDKIHISYSAYSEGEEIIKSEGYQITIGSNYLSEELEKSLLGTKVGDTIEVNMQVSEDYKYSEELAGKELTYKITVDCKYHTIKPELDETFIKEHSTCTTIEEYRAYVEQILIEERQKNAEQDAFDEVWDEIIEKTNVLKYPEAEIENEQAFFISYAAGINYDGTAEEVEEMAIEYAKEAVKQKMVLYAIADENDLIPDEKQMREYVASELETNGQTEEEYLETYSLSAFDYAMENDWISEYVYEKVKELILKQQAS